MNAVKERFDSKLSNRDKGWLRQATQLAKTSTYSYRHGAVITKGGRLLSSGVNSERNDPRMFAEFSKENLSEHAEMAALRQLGGEARGAKIYVSRWMWKQGEDKTGLSRPCNNCYQALVKAGIKEIIYTTD